MGIKDGAVPSVCEGAESCSCGDHDVQNAIWGPGGEKHTVGLYNECKCDFWSRICEDTGAGEACDYAAEYCCGDYGHGLINVHEFGILNSPTCYCDFFNYAQNEFDHALKTKIISTNKEFTNPCGQLKKWADDIELNDERTSLEAIYNETNGSKWKKKDGWMNETLDHCKWYGISCSLEGHITSIDLKDNNLAGQFPVYTRNASHWGYPVPESAWKYTKYGLANLYRLETVRLDNNNLTGTIDSRPLYNLASLKHFDISGNQLSGEIDALVAPSISHSDFSNNRFNSMRRFEKYKGSYQTLRYCDVSNNAIQMNATARIANIPPNIEQLFAQNNQIYGSLPESSEYLLRLLHLSMSNNYISGSLPESLNHLPWILTFNISSNALSGQVPHFTESFVSLQEIDMSNQTNGFTGSIPKRIGFFQSLKILKLAGNKITGTVPSSIGYMAALEVLDLSTNRFKNSIPSELGKLGGE